ncbi:hypothetical protein DMH01_02885 [Amycolatopsis sp. WAC 04182]|uniref:hypothetical protein n=1 Tax=Amycolatopsis sp. WAC 04182 TaxID=2203198 RepID=UPI000F77CDD5|nr:hypothetical protein [Amycolatopsis sp. WAC 04182]RSN65350.1 hypothetical protein DMH01_02885 [Amycolatopsis sp. WAC 04182]
MLFYPDPLEFAGSGALELSAPAVTVVTALGLTGGATLTLRPDRIVVPATGAVDAALSGSPALALDGHPHFWDGVTLASAGQLVWTPIEVRGSGSLDLSSVGTLKFDDPNAMPIYVWSGETWRPATVSAWNGRAWLPLRADDIRIY